MRTGVERQGNTRAPFFLLIFIPLSGVFLLLLFFFFFILFLSFILLLRVEKECLSRYHNNFTSPVARPHHGLCRHRRSAGRCDRSVRRRRHPSARDPCPCPCHRPGPCSCHCPSPSPSPSPCRLCPSPCHRYHHHHHRAPRSSSRHTGRWCPPSQRRRSGHSPRGTSGGIWRPLLPSRLRRWQSQ